MNKFNTTNAILIVEDHEALRSTVVEWFTVMYPECIIREASTGEQGVRLALEIHPSIVLMDINLPGIDGFEATRIIKKEDSSIQVIIVSVHEGGFYMKKALEAGGTSFIPKRKIYDILPGMIKSLLKVKNDELS